MAGGGDKVVSGGADGRVIVWDVAQSKWLRNYRGHTDMVLSVACCYQSPDCFITSSQDGSVRFWDLRLPKPARNITACSEGVYTSLATSKESLAVGGERGVVQVLDLREDNFPLFACPKLHARSVHRLAFAPRDCDLLASISEDNTVKVHSIETYETIYCCEAHEDFVRGVAWQPDAEGCGLLTCGWDSKVLQHNITRSKTTTEESLASSTTEPVSDWTGEVSQGEVVMETASRLKHGTENGYVVQVAMEP